MRKKRFLTALLLGVVFCFVVSGVGYGEIEKWMDEDTFSYMRGRFLESQISYIMANPTNFLNVSFHYGHTGSFRWSLPKSVNIKGKIIVSIYDNRDIFSSKSGTSLLNSFKRALESIYSFIKDIATDMNTDIVAKLQSGEEIPLAYFNQGEYHLWEE